MFVKTISSLSCENFDKQINQAIEVEKKNGQYCKDIKFSVVFDEDMEELGYSAMLIFEKN